jgi:NADH-quinone oxidoreductase subunit J
MMTKVLFYVFGGLPLLAAVGMLGNRNIFQSAMLLLVCLLSVAGVYVFLYAEFLAVSQILVYAGGVLVLIIFAIMLSPPRMVNAPIAQPSRWPQGLLLGAALFALLYYALNASNVAERPVPTSRSIKDVGLLLMTDWVGPFELAGLLLLVSLVGAAVMANDAKHKETNGAE